MNPWELPRTALLGGRAYAIRADFRDVLDILHRLDDDSEPPYIRWQVALALFYPEGLPPRPAPGGGGISDPVFERRRS